MPSPFLPVPPGLISMAEAAARLQICENVARGYFTNALRRPAWLKRWLSAKGKRLSKPTMIPRLLKDEKHGRMAYVKLTDIRLIERAEADGSANTCRPSKITRNGKTYISVPEFARRSGMNEKTVYCRIRRGLLPAIKKRSPKHHGVHGSVPTIYVPASQLKTVA